MNNKLLTSTKTKKAMEIIISVRFCMKTNKKNGQKKFIESNLFEKTKKLIK